jgi:hypothetical protein
MSSAKSLTGTVRVSLLFGAVIICFYQLNDIYPRNIGDFYQINDIMPCESPLILPSSPHKCRMIRTEQGC